MTTPSASATAMHLSLTVLLVNAFTDNGSGGNPAGVVLDAPDLTCEQKTDIARQVGYSETAFVQTGSDADFHVEFYTPEGEVDFCGHATVATFSAMRDQGHLQPGHYTQKTKAGILGIEIETDVVRMEQALPQTRPGPAVDSVCRALGIPEAAIRDTQLPIEIISTGLPDILVPVASGYLSRLQPNFQHLAECSRNFEAIGFHVFELGEDEMITAHCRNFAPLYGIDEEAATGSGNGALSCYLAKHCYPGKTQFRFEQGLAMGSPSSIEAALEYSCQSITRVMVQGKATIIGQRDITYA
ncbi:PhzF family phenazine biosynthesis protein [Photobacterium atrarenae]|uniref:PhzF family phenazine biosynthesis protein n=1 Tax=Photobacterium atrarenae TaxID=865757 RepID=A0ABY5GKI3_9GAMM|nr:PhzF family phenazine biosynthesis protein [Photobacterium atrarenae]UTV29656.1 PhzF family phenazine biosynthesis protein [Photobacterium atrarenae]